MGPTRREAGLISFVLSFLWAVWAKWRREGKEEMEERSRVRRLNMVWVSQVRA